MIPSKLFIYIFNTMTDSVELIDNSMCNRMHFNKDDPDTWSTSADGSDDHNGKPTRCEICREDLNKVSRTNHFQNAHFTEGTSLPCSQCKGGRSGLYKNARSFIRHAKSTHRFQCNWLNCNSPSVKTRGEIFWHIADAHRLGVPCKRCEKSVPVHRYLSHVCKSKDVKNPEASLTSDDDFSDFMPSRRRFLKSQRLERDRLQKSVQDEKERRKKSQDEDKQSRHTMSSIISETSSSEEDAHSRVDQDASSEMKVSEIKKKRRKFHFSPVSPPGIHQVSSSSHDGENDVLHGSRKAKVPKTEREPAQGTFVVYKCKNCGKTNSKMRDHHSHEKSCGTIDGPRSGPEVEKLESKLASAHDRLDELGSRLNRVVQHETGGHAEGKRVVNAIMQEVAAKDREVKEMQNLMTNIRGNSNTSDPVPMQLRRYDILIGYMQEGIASMKRKLSMAKEIVSMNED